MSLSIPLKLPALPAFLKSLGFAGCLSLTTGLLAAELHNPRNFYVDLSPRPDARLLAAFDVCVLHPHAELDMEPGHSQGGRYLALLDVSHLRTGSRESMIAASRHVASRPTARDPRLRKLDLADPQWTPWVVEALADPAARKGFDGFALGLGDEQADPAERSALLTLAATLRQRYPDKRILLDLQSGLGPETHRVADGFLALGVYTCQGREGSVELTSIADVQQRSRRIREILLQGMDVLAVDFAPADDRPACSEAARRLAELGALPFVTTPSLQGINLGPLQEATRRVLVLHGWDPAHTGEASPDKEATVTARHLRHALEWLGCEVVFHAADGRDFLPAAHDFDAVILDPGLVLRDEQQRQLAAWLPSLHARNIPLLITAMPWSDSVARQQAMQHLTLGGSARPVPGLVKTHMTRMDSTALRPQARIQAHSFGFLSLAAPSSARVFLASSGEDAGGQKHAFDQVFLTAWGGAWIEPAAGPAGPQTDLPVFLAAWLATAGLDGPVPDTTTRDGRRVFFSHIDSTGFSTPSTLPGFPLCSEVMRDRILDRYQLPVTVSVCEADLRCWLPGQEAEDAPRLEHVARSIFEMPQVQAASNSFSRPVRWTSGEDICSPLNERAHTTRRDLEREIAGSMSYAHRRLLPVGKEVSLMLWPDSAPPSAAALRYCDALGIESLLHTGDASAPAASSARLAPVTVRCRFSDVRTEQGVKSLETAFDSCAAEPLHAISAASYAASLRDARSTRILRSDDARWIILNDGRCRTLRLPTTSGVPDMAACTGVSGFTVSDGWLYVHTMGLPRTELVLSPAATAPHLYLAESSADVEFMDLASRRATFHVRDLRPVEMVLGGFEPRGLCAYLENGRPYSVTADSRGFVRLELVCRATVSLQSLPPATEAAMR